MEAACPQCGHEDLHHSRPQSFRERLRRRLTRLVPVRCHACGWRGWRLPLMRATGSHELDSKLAESEFDRDKP